MKRAETIPNSAFRRPPPLGKGPAQHVVVLGLIVLLHGGLFLAMQAKMDRTTAQVAPPKEVFARFITAEPAVPTPAPMALESPPAKTAPTSQLAKPSFAKAHRSHPSVPAQTPPPVTTTLPLANTAPLSTAKAESPSTSSDAPAAMPSTPSPPAVPAAPRTVSGVQYIRPPAPDYPALSRRMKEEGTVRLRILVNESGRAQNVEIEKTSGFTRLDSAARDAVQLALFKPHLEDGRPVPVYVAVPINFSLQ
jgi:protein TonB